VLKALGRSVCNFLFRFSPSYSSFQALRRLQRDDIFESDFVVVHGDLVADIKLEEILFEHRYRYENNPKAIFTTIYKHATPTHESRSLEDDAVVGLDEETRRILFWANDTSQTSVNIDPFLVTSHNLRLRYDLLDTHIDICGVEVLQLFLENFDYENLREDFIKGTLGDEIYHYELYAHVVHNQYAARVKDLKTYVSVTRGLSFLFFFFSLFFQNT